MCSVPAFVFLGVVSAIVFVGAGSGGGGGGGNTTASEADRRSAVLGTSAWMNMGGGGKNGGGKGAQRGGGGKPGGNGNGGGKNMKLGGGTDVLIMLGGGRCVGGRFIAPPADDVTFMATCGPCTCRIEPGSSRLTSTRPGASNPFCWDLLLIMHITSAEVPSQDRRIP